jgi:hypothetical protein
MGYELRQFNTTRPLRFLLVLTSDHITGGTGKTPVVTLRKTGGTAFAAPLGPVAEIGNGWYEVAARTSDADVLGPLTLHATAPACDPLDDTFTVVNYDPDNFTINNPTQVTPDVVTLRSVIQDALLELGVVGIVDPGDSGLYEVGRRWANRLLDEWNSNHDAAWAQTFQSFVLPAGKSPVTIGPGGDLDVVQRPVDLQSCRQVINNSWYWIKVQGPQWYRHQTYPTWTGATQTDVYYEPAWPLGNLYFYPIQSGASHMVLEYRTVLAQYDLASVVTLPPGGLNAFVLTLAEALQGPMRMTLTPDQQRRARVARAAFVANNRTPPNLATCDYGLPGGRKGRGRFNYQTGRVEA